MTCLSRSFCTSSLIMLVSSYDLLYSNGSLAGAAFAKFSLSPFWTISRMYLSEVMSLHFSKWCLILPALKFLTREWRRSMLIFWLLPTCSFISLLSCVLGSCCCCVLGFCCCCSCSGFSFDIGTRCCCCCCCCGC